MSDWYSGATRFDRIADALERNGFDALLALTPENAHYLAGHGNFIASHWRLPGIFSAAVNASGERAVVSGDFGIDPSASPPYYTHFPYTSWTESIDVRGAPGPTVQQRVAAARHHLVHRPAQFDLAEVFDRVADAVRHVAPAARRIGADLRAVDEASRSRLESRLMGVSLVDASTVFDDLRAIKDPDEIGHLRLACELTEIGITGAISRLRRGMTEAAVNSCYQVAVHEAVVAHPRFSAFQQAEGLASIGIGVDSAHRVEPGQTIKFDMQVDIAGYHSDVGRTVAFGPTEDQRVVYETLHRSLMAMQRRVRPGVRFSDLYQAGAQAMREQGFTNYSRGHLGHSDGLTQHFEEPPFIAPDEHRPLVPNMVLSLELPYYLYGVGAFQLERMLLVTPDGHELFDRLPFDLPVDVPL